MTDHDGHGHQPPDDPVQRARQALSETADELEGRANLRRAIAEGTVPPKATAALAERLEDLAARIRGAGE